MEGKRIGAMLTARAAARRSPTGASAAWRASTWRALSFVEYLIGAARPGRHERPAAGHGRDAATSTRPSSRSTARTHAAPRTQRAGAERLAHAEHGAERPAGRGLSGSGRSNGRRGRAGRPSPQRARPAQHARAGRAAATRLGPVLLALQERLEQALALGQHDQPDLLVLRDAAPAPWPPRARRRARPAGPRGRALSASAPVQTRPCATACDLVAAVLPGPRRPCATKSS